MFIKQWFRKERLIWHKRFIPSLITGISVALITYFFTLTTSNIVLFSSLGASAAIITHDKIHKLNILRTVILAYLLSLTVSLLILYLSNILYLQTNWMIFLAVTMVTIGIYLFNVFHPPAVASSIAFLIFEGPLRERLLVFLSVIVLLIMIKFLTYAFYYEQLKMKKFHIEFRKFESKEKKFVEKEEKSLLHFLGFKKR